MDYKECLKIHGYIADNSDSETECSNVEEIYNKYKPPPMPYHKFKHRITTIYADSKDSNPLSTSVITTTATAAATTTTQRYTQDTRVEARGATSNVDNILQQQLDQFSKTYQQRTTTPAHSNKPSSRPNIVQPTITTTTTCTGVHQHQTTRVRTPTLPTTTTNQHNRTTRTSTEHRQPSVITISRAISMQQQPTSSNIQVAYQPLHNERTTRPRAQQQSQQAEEEMNECCCCVC